MRLYLNNMALRLTVAVAGVVVLAFTVGAYVYSRHHYEGLLAAHRASAQTQADTIRIALERMMVEKDRSLIAQMVESFAHDPSVSAVMLLNRSGKLIYSSVSPGTDVKLTRDSATCVTCHEEPPERRELSRSIETENGEVLRIVTPIINRELCHSCHNETQRINGVLIVDIKAGEMRASLNRDLLRMILISGLLALVVMAGIGAILRLGILRRLRLFETTARRIAAGDWSLRLPVSGDDSLAWLARQFNQLVDAVTGLLADLRHKSDELETIINSIDDGVIVIDRHLIVAAANDALVRRLGRERPLIVGQLASDVFAGCCPEAAAAVVLCLKDGERRTIAVEIEAPGGATRFEEIRASPILRGGSITHVVQIWRDTTERRFAEARVAEAHRLASLGMLASGFSHELNTPLGTILTCVDGIRRTLASTPLDLDYIRDSARVAQEQLVRCRAVTQQFLRMARGDPAGEDVVSLTPLTAAVVRLVEPTARERGVKLTAAPTAASPTVRAVESDVQQVLLNILMNAIQACAKGGQVELAILPGPPLCVTVKDDGRGMTPEELEHIFEPFYSQRDGGFGLGLFTSIELARRWGGAIRVTSTPGSGSLFTISFPTAPVAPRLAANGENP
ncbi:MAG: PAS domain-containing protein [Deltaproteobacteria bacterium]|nr:PAS domain-containing protein [Deltaproteobacteria bacterium]